MYIIEMKYTHLIRETKERQKRKRMNEFIDQSTFLFSIKMKRMNHSNLFRAV